MKRGAKTISIIIILIVLLFLIRLISPTQIDDVNPTIPCPELERYNPDTLYVIPNYKNIPISNNQTWCNLIKNLNKTIEMHGIDHEPYRGFLTENITQKQMDFAMSEFQNCFNQTPEKFKPPQLKISKENKLLIQDNNLKLETNLNQITHKVYHCNNTGIIPNRIIKIF